MNKAPEEPRQALTDDEIDRRFAAAEAQLGERWRSKCKATWRCSPHTAVLARKATDLMAEEQCALEAARTGMLTIDATLPTHSGVPIRRRLTVPVAAEQFMCIAADVNDFLPKPGAIRPGDHAIVMKAQRGFAEHFHRELHTASCDCDYVKQIGAALYACRYDIREHRAAKKIWRPPSAFQKCLLAEANRLDPRNGGASRGWRGDNARLAHHFAACFRALSSLIYDLPQGRPVSSDPNAQFLEMCMELRGPEFDRGIRMPGDKRKVGMTTPERAKFLEKIRQSEVLRRHGITEGGMKRALHNMDTSRSRR